MQMHCITKRVSVAFAVAAKALRHFMRCSMDLGITDSSRAHSFCEKETISRVYVLLVPQIDDRRTQTNKKTVSNKFLLKADRIERTLCGRFSENALQRSNVCNICPPQHMSAIAPLVTLRAAKHNASMLLLAKKKRLTGQRFCLLKL